MAVAKKDQERANYAWMYGVQARKDGRERVVPDFWREHAEAWLQGFDGVALDGADKPKAVGAEMEAEVDDAAVARGGT
ncbi:hypothetical protein [Mesorhizobium sp. B2-1-3A]|uniref:hypothetical protein n=1 Tax=Mesorhizobium sp. B2-1-3A TaxID=2589971 RepID=UPI001127D053|nr:hypothetical protein [Mesorhizobium sp. B2-1-3A]TPM94950.1 hypothetical protein FJ977_23080 [Mesorhizobium sp. B2-1-3A]